MGIPLIKASNEYLIYNIESVVVIDMKEKHSSVRQKIIMVLFLYGTGRDFFEKWHLHRAQMSYKNTGGKRFPEQREQQMHKP